jgi:hypothetical protein
VLDGADILTVMVYKDWGKSYDLHLLSETHPWDIFNHRESGAKGTLYFQYLECYNLIYQCLSVGIMRFSLDWFDGLIGGCVPSPTPTIRSACFSCCGPPIKGFGACSIGNPDQSDTNLLLSKMAGNFLYPSTPAWGKTAQMLKSR